MSTASYAQDSTFNNIYTSEYGLPDFSDIIVHDDTIVGIGTGKYNITEGQAQGILIVRFDSSGQQIDQELLKDPNENDYGIPLQYGRITKLGRYYIYKNFN